MAKYFKAKDAVLAGLVAAFYGNPEKMAKHLADAMETEDFPDMMEQMDQEQQKAMDEQQFQGEQDLQGLDQTEARVMARLKKKGYKLVKAGDEQQQDMGSSSSSDDEQQAKVIARLKKKGYKLVKAADDQKPDFLNSSSSSEDTEQATASTDSVEIENVTPVKGVEVPGTEVKQSMASAMRQERASRNKKKLGL